MGKPIKGKHAIEVVIFTITFQANFSKKILDALITLRESQKENFPVFNLVNKVAFQLGPDMSENVQATSGVNLSGVSLQRLDQEGKPLWMLQANENAISVSCFDYERWDNISEQALKYILSVINVVDDDRNPIETIGLQYVDRFVGKDDGYNLNKVFNTKSKFFSKQTGKSGKLWHLYQGWFQTVEEYKANQLNVLNLQTNSLPAEIITTIDHTTRLHFTSCVSLADATKKFLTDIYNLLHNTNKEILINLLNARQRKVIKL